MGPRRAPAAGATAVAACAFTVGLAAAGCYGPRLDDCRGRCGASSRCPEALTCVDGVCVTPGASCAGGSPDASAGSWYGEYGRRRRLTVPTGAVGAPLAAFPLLVSLAADADLASAVVHPRADALDVAFHDESGEALAHEVEAYDPATGALVAWVSIPRLPADAATTLYLAYGSPTARDRQRAADVWRDYRGVWHLADATAIHDSAGRVSPAEAVGEGASTGLGRVGAGLRLDGRGWVEVGDQDVLDFDAGAPFTLTVWARLSTLPADSWQTIAWKGGSNPGAAGYVIEVSNYHKMASFCVHDGDGSPQTCAPPAIAGPLETWRHLAGVSDGAVVLFYRDAVVSGPAEATAGLAPATSLGLSFGAQEGGAYALTGALDEIRVAAAARSAAWLAAEVENQMDPAAFVDVGAPEPAPGEP